MGVEIIRLGERQAAAGEAVREQDLARLSFTTHSVAQPPMSIWLMSAPARQPLVPWWTYSGAIDQDLHRLHDAWGVTSAQSLFDLLFLYQLKRSAGPHLYAIFPGNVRTDGWEKLRDASKATFQRGQGCVYRLEASCAAKLAVNWVPFYQPQSIVKDPTFDNLWRLFLAARNDDVANSLSFFSLSDPSMLPEAINILIQAHESRSEALARVVDWFAVYSSPISEKHAPCSIAYMRDESRLAVFDDLKAGFSGLLGEVRRALFAETSPGNVYRFLSRYLPL